MKIKLTKAQIQSIVDDPQKAADAKIKISDPWWIIVLKVVKYLPLRNPPCRRRRLPRRLLRQSRRRQNPLPSSYRHKRRHNTPGRLAAAFIFEPLSGLPCSSHNERHSFPWNCSVILFIRYSQSNSFMFFSVYVRNSS